MSDEWYLLKVQDHEIFGPAPLDQLRLWASGAKISPMDRVSNDDRRTWLHAPMILELQMDWLIEMPDNFLYGPTNIGTLQEFLALGEIDENVTVINARDGLHSRIGDLPFFKASPHRIRGAVEINGQNPERDAGRVAWLERQVMELQRDIGEWQEACASLRRQFIEATGRDPM